MWLLHKPRFHQAWARKITCRNGSCFEERFVRWWTLVLVVHRDGTLMPDLCGKDHVDRLPIIVTGSGVCQLLKVNKIIGGTGKNQATAVLEALEEWSISKKVWLGCVSIQPIQTQASTLVLVLKLRECLGIGIDLLYLACSHHIMEILAGAAFSASLSPSSVSEVLLFKVK